MSKPQPVIYSAIDVAADSTDPRPNSYASAALFDMAAARLGDVVTIDFESAPVGEFISLEVYPGVILTGFDVNRNNQSILNSPYNIPDGLFGYNTTVGGSQFVSMFGGSLTFTFASPIEAFGGYISGAQLSNSTVTFNDGSDQEIPIINAGELGCIQFLGFTDAHKRIDSVTINAGSDIIGIDDVRFVTSHKK